MSEAAMMQTTPEVWQRDYPMARLSTWRAGGAAKWLFTPLGLAAAASDDPMLTLPYTPPPQVAAAAGEDAPMFVGYGSNLFVRDGGYDGIVIRTAPGLAQLEHDDSGGVYAAAGVGSPKLARFCAALGLDAAFFAGIPGTVGGALAMNAGCYGGETWQFVEQVNIIADGKVSRLPPDDFNISYRRVCHKHKRDIYFVGATFRFPPATADEVNAKIKTMLKQRAAAQPLGNACAGSVFCNPPGDHAGRLIEQCGLKNHRVGGAVVSDKHANFIVNDGDATAADIEQLMYQVQSQVAEKTGVTLQPEVRIVGRAP